MYIYYYLFFYPFFSEIYFISLKKIPKLKNTINEKKSKASLLLFSSFFVSLKNNKLASISNAALRKKCLKLENRVI